MSKIKRNEFLKMSTLAMLTPFTNNFLSGASPAISQKEFLSGDELMKKMVVANDKQVAKLLQTINAENVNFSRRVGADFAFLSAAWSLPESTYYHNPQLAAKLEILVNVLKSFQKEDGTVNMGNLESPPDTAFLLELLTSGAHLLKKDNAAEIKNVNEGIKKFILKSGEGLITGGVHTPNHRWVICAALARMNALYPNQKYLDRIEDWLGEGIYMDSEGHYPERSANYSNVENNSLITMARLLNKPQLFEPVRKNLEMTYFYMDPNGDLVISDSRRQDQYTSKSIISFYRHYRYMAIKDKNPNFAGIAGLIEQMKGFEEEVLDRDLFHFLENALLQQPLPVAVKPADNYEKLFTTSKLLRIRRGNTTATLFGGVDWPLIIASGRSNSPNVFLYRKGNAILKYIRLSSSFFSMGYFYSDGIKKEGNKYILYKKLEVPYYQPLPKNKRNASGDYKLSPSIDDRFWNKMDFENRPVSNVKTLETKLTFEESNGKVNLNFAVTGLEGVNVTIELCFLEGGKLSGATEATDGNSFLEKDMGTYEFGGDTIQFGPGAVAHKSITNLEGERYSTHFGSLKTTGKHVYITGVTPFNHTLTFN